jgi:hypothetical protein
MKCTFIGGKRCNCSCFENDDKYSCIIRLLLICLWRNIYCINVDGLVWFWFMVFNSTFNNIPVISWWSVLLVENPAITTDLSQVTDKGRAITLWLVICVFLYDLCPSYIHNENTLICRLFSLTKQNFVNIFK